MKVLIDTNVSLTYITGRDTDPDKESVGKFIELCMNETVEAYIAFHSVSNMWFVLTHLKNPSTGTLAFTKEKVRKLLKAFCKIVDIVGADNDAVISALDNEDFKDFEDCLQEKCALTADADYIVTSNIKDYQHSAIPAITPKDFLETISKEENK